MEGYCPPDINELIRLNQSFVIYRIPYEKKLRFMQASTDSVHLLYSIEELNERNGYIIAPFHISANRPIILMQGEEKAWDINPMFPGHISTETIQKNKPSTAYVERFQTFLKALKEQELNKLVLSRSITIPKEEFSPAEAFSIACHRYIRSYVYLYHTPETGTWLGSTPEVLLSGRDGSWHTVALAGTQPLQQGKVPSHWDEKNREEQVLVANYIRNQLSTFHIHPEEEGPYTVRAGELAHLKSDFRFSLPNENRLGDLLSALHPTPAICGLPKEKACQFICENEGYDRKYYSGFIGRLAPQGQSDLYVNLRCMNIEQDTLTLYAGGGILSSSVLEEEWQETEDKLQTMKRLIN